MELIERSNSRNSMDPFDEGIIQCYYLGKLMKTKTPPFLLRNVRKYKRLCVREAERASMQGSDSFTSPGTVQGSVLGAVSSASDLGRDYVDQSLVGFHAVGSSAFGFYHSWPSEVVLQSGEKNRKWQGKVDSKHCPFCKPSVRCRTVKELVDHLDTYHSHFVYRPRRVGNNAIIFMKLREGYQPRIDPMFVVGAEGYMLSAKTRRKHSYYCGTANRRQYCYPFVLRRSHFSAKSENFHGVPGAVPILRKTRQTGERASGTVADSSGTRSGQRSVGSNVSSGVLRKGGKAFDTVPTLALRDPHVAQRNFRREARGASVHVMDGAVVQSGQPHFRKRVPPVSRAKHRGQYQNPHKRSIRDTPRGMENEHTQHLRAKMFGDNARHRLAGRGVKSVLSPQASDGRLFHSVTNLPVDTELYNEGYDSDGDSDREIGTEKQWRRRQREDLINEFIDMEPGQKYFLSLWNHCIYEASAVRNDKDVFQLVVGFAETFGAEVKRMKLEVEFANTVAHMWRLGIMDASGVLEAMRTFRDCDSTSRKSGIPHPEFKMAHRLLDEVNIAHTRVREYRGCQKISANVKLHQGMLAWVTEEELKSRTQYAAAKATNEAEAITHHWMANVNAETIETERVA